MEPTFQLEPVIGALRNKSLGPQLGTAFVNACNRQAVAAGHKNVIYVGDRVNMPQQLNGKSTTTTKRETVAAGHKNVIYVGDRVKLPQQLNGKSSNLNHMILNKIYPHAHEVADISWKDILMVMDCDHKVHREYYQKCCSTMLDQNTAVCLCPQYFWNHNMPDFFDNRNLNFMFRLMPYYFGAGCCMITGASSA